MLRKWDFWYWFVFVTYSIVVFSHEATLPDTTGIGAKSLGDFLLMTGAIIGGTYTWAILKVIQISTIKFRTSEILWNKVVYVILIIVLTCLFAISIYCLFAMSLNILNE